MGIFSTPPPLREDIKAAISPLFFSASVHEKTQKNGLERVAKSQEAILGALKPGEDITVIIPCYAGNTGYHGLAIATSERVLELTGKRISTEIPLAEIVDVKRMASPHGTFLLVLISDTAAPFAQFAHGDLSNRSTRTYWDNVMQVPMLTRDLMTDFIQKTGFSE